MCFSFHSSVLPPLISFADVFICENQTVQNPLDCFESIKSQAMKMYTFDDGVLRHGTHWMALAWRVNQSILFLTSLFSLFIFIDFSFFVSLLLFFLVGFNSQWAQLPFFHYSFLSLLTFSNFLLRSKWIEFNIQVNYKPCNLVRSIWVTTIKPCFTYTEACQREQWILTLIIRSFFIKLKEYSTYYFVHP